VTTSRACSLVVLLLPSLPVYASGKGYAAPATIKSECVAEVELTRVSVRAPSLEFAVSIRHDAPTGVANVKWKYAIDYVGDDGASHTFSSNAGLADARSSQSLRSRPPNGTQVPVRSISGYKVTDTTCSYNRSAKSAE